MQLLNDYERQVRWIMIASVVLGVLNALGIIVVLVEMLVAGR